MRRPWLTWLFVGTLFALCGALGVLQYQWIGEVSVAARDRLRAALQVNLARLSQDFNNEIGSAIRSVAPIAATNSGEIEQQIEARYEQRKSGQGLRIFRRIGLVVPREGAATLELLDPSDGRLKAAEWPDEWSGTRRSIEARLGAEKPMGNPWNDSDGVILETPVFAPGGPGGRGGGRGPGRGFGRTELAWVVFELNVDYVKDTLLPEVVARHLEANEFEVQVRTRSHPPLDIWASDAKASGVANAPDGSVGLLEMRMGMFMEGGRGRGGRSVGGGPDSGRWILFARHKAGSLDAVVEQTRWRNLGVTGGVLLLLVVTVWALIRFTRKAEQLAHMQMEFVAGVSHELRTPLTAIYTAGHNLRGARVAQNPAQVERYGEMIQQESGRLRDLVEQVLQFASANAGKVIQAPSPVSVESVIEQSVESSRPAIQAARCTVEKSIPKDLPAIMADPLALKHALQNLLSNAVKYAARENPWIGISASGTQDGVEIRVADRGPGIPEEEQEHIFDAFYRGRRAVQDQIHGAGLGLNLVKKIVEAHGGSIRVKSAPERGAEFIVRLPAAPAEAAR